MQVEIITIGDELLIGQVIDTNSAWMAQQLNKLGYMVWARTAIGDDALQITKTIKEACKRSNVILITGGLGPTRDDITKHTLCKIFKSKLVMNATVLKDIETLFARHNRILTEVNSRQAELPHNCIALRNKVGTAAGMLFEVGEKVIVSMPGVPYEMQEIMTTGVLPYLKKKYDTPQIVHHTLLTHGIGESSLAQIIEKWEDALPKHMKLAYLPQPGAVRLRLTAVAYNKNLKHEVALQIKKLKPLIKNYLYGEGDSSMQEIVAKKLLAKNKTLALAESCTGGYIAHLITSMPGSSAFFKGGIVSYANEIKTSELKVPKSVLEKFGAVSEQTVYKMAMAAKKKFKTDYAIATSGIAGPTGATPTKPLGLVCIGIATPLGCETYTMQYGSNRMRNIAVFAQSALNLLRKAIEKNL